MSTSFLISALLQGFAFAGLGYGIYLSLRVFNVPDITTDGSYTLGAVVSAISLVNGIHPVAALLLSAAAGFTAGACTGIIHTRLRVNALLSGILVMTALYSVNLILLGRPNLPLIGVQALQDMLGVSSFSQGMLIGGIALLLSLILLYILRTDFGIAMRATGNSPSMVRAMGVSTDRMKISGLAMANACTAVSGSLIAQYQGFADINMGIGIVIAGLGAVMIGEVLVPARIRSLPLILAAVLAGGLLFRGAIALALSAGVNPSYLRLLTALIVLAIVASGSLRKSASP
jgi:putative ABC transport system permease protein